MENLEFYNASLMRQLATNLFYGWGYNFYREENQLRADDQLVRAKAASLLGTAMAAGHAAEAEYRRRFLPPPSREHPFPDAAAVTTAQRLERVTREIGALEAAVQHQPVPENDRMTQRYRQEAPTLRTLIHHDEQLVGQCEFLRLLVAGKELETVLENVPKIEQGLEAIRTTLGQRAAVLLDRAK